MNTLTRIPEEEREHFMQCSVCREYFDMRDLSQVVYHQHWPGVTGVSFSHSVRVGKKEPSSGKGNRESENL